MSNCQIRFLYNKEDVIIRCQRNEIMKNIIARYGIKSGLLVDELYYYYTGNKINPELTLAQLNNKDLEILITVHPKDYGNNENKMKESNYIKNAKNIDPAIVEFTNDYKIILLDENNNKTKLNLEDFKNTQMIDQSEIKCSKCFNTKADTQKNKFYYCFECDKNFCPQCQSLHKEHKNIIDYSFKYFKCPDHKDQNFISYCLSCKKICVLFAQINMKHII